MGFQVRHGKAESPNETLYRDEWIGFWTVSVTYPDGHVAFITEKNPIRPSGDMTWKDLENHLADTGGIISFLFLDLDGRKYYTIPGMRGYRCYMNIRSDSHVKVSPKGMETTVGKTRLYRGMEYTIDIVHNGQTQPMVIITWVDAKGNMHQEIKMGSR